jgi:hypothetical protein
MKHREDIEHTGHTEHTEHTEHMASYAEEIAYVLPHGLLLLLLFLMLNAYGWRRHIVHTSSMRYTYTTAEYRIGKVIMNVLLSHWHITKIWRLEVGQVKYRST